MVTSQTIFLRDPADQTEFERLIRQQHGAELPITTFVAQPPCCGAALAIEAWAVGSPSVKVERFPHAVAVSYGGLRWIYCGGIALDGAGQNVHDMTSAALQKLRNTLQDLGAGYEDVVRTWFYLGEITGAEGETQRYKELNRARTEFYHDIAFYRGASLHNTNHPVYPASTGIGASGKGLVLACTAFQTDRKDVLLVPLENPQQVPAFAYHAKYSPQSPKFSRAMALVLPEFTMTWISGTASIVDSESCFPGDIEKQTEQTIDNIEKLIAPANFSSRGVEGAGNSLHDLAKLRVYIKRPEDFLKCKEVCERRFGAVPAIYAVSDVCRPELLVEIEGIAFSPRRAPGAATGLAGRQAALADGE